jgi:2-keto-3-deoxy-L-rhamnonate aldolase RhmA
MGGFVALELLRRAPGRLAGVIVAAGSVHALPDGREKAMRADLAEARAGCARAGLISGIFCSGGAAAARRIAEGFDLVTPGNDAGTLKAAGAQAVDAARAKG